MSKELVISSNSHETRVAIVEDDQLVEVYFQRANEYSLAGSIHKGRVTRVLPGMQSAFVDLGLERDTFLYVSDFLEENGDEDDRPGDDATSSPGAGGRREASGREFSGRETARDNRETGRDNREQGRERSPALPAQAALPDVAESFEPIRTEPSPRIESRVETDETSSEVGPPVDARTQEDADRKGRRSRRRRSRGRGFPDSKYAADVTRESSARAPESETVSLEEEDDSSPDVILLPGESLAKYTNRSAPPAFAERVSPREVLDTPSEADLVDDLLSESEAELAEESLEAGLAESEAVLAEGESEAAAADALEAVIELVAERLAEEVLDASSAEPVEPAVSVSILELVARDNADTTIYEEEDDFSTAAIEDQVDAAEARLEGDSLSVDEEYNETLILEMTGLPVEETLVVDEEAGEDDSDEATGENPAVTDLDDIAADIDLEAGESSSTSGATDPAEAPATASVRETNARYPHRQSSRRVRRKRGGDRAPGDRPAGDRFLQSDRSAERTETPVPATETRSTGRPDRNERPDRTERAVMPSISDLLREGQEIIVQIAKEPLGQKGARITSHIALPGRFVVFMPTLDHVGVSRKIGTEEERLRLKRILQAGKTGITGGFIVRTAGEGQAEQEIAADMAYLYNLWLDIRSKAEKRKAPVLLHHDLDIVHRILRDQLSDMFKAIWVDNEEVYESVLRFMQRFQPALVGRVKMYTRPAPIFDAFSITTEIEKALKPKVWLKSGGYIVVNQTEALVAIDVNTGKFVGKSNRLEDTITKINTEAVREIVRQIRLRDLGGIIVIDFIDMDERKNRQKVMQTLEEAMRADRAPYKILQFNDFGLVAITRKRVKQSLERTLCSLCPTCEGAGYTKSVVTVVGEILQEANKVRPGVEGKNVELRVFPEVAKHLKSNQNSDLEEIESILGRPVLVVSDASLHPEKFDMAW